MQVWDANGRIIVDANDRVGRFAPTPIYVNAGQSGSVDVGGTGHGFAFALPVNDNSSPANIQINGTVISWSYYNGGYSYNPAGDCLIYYGAY